MTVLVCYLDYTHPQHKLGKERHVTLASQSWRRAPDSWGRETAKNTGYGCLNHHPMGEKGHPLPTYLGI